MITKTYKYLYSTVKSIMFGETTNNLLNRLDVVNVYLQDRSIPGLTPRDAYFFILVRNNQTLCNVLKELRHTTFYEGSYIVGEEAKYTVIKMKHFANSTFNKNFLESKYSLMWDHEVLIRNKEKYFYDPILKNYTDAFHVITKSAYRYSILLEMVGCKPSDDLGKQILEQEFDSKLDFTFETFDSSQIK